MLTNTFFVENRCLAMVCPVARLCRVSDVVTIDDCETCIHKERNRGDLLCIGYTPKARWCVFLENSSNQFFGYNVSLGLIKRFLFRCEVIIFGGGGGGGSTEFSSLSGAHGNIWGWVS